MLSSERRRGVIVMFYTNLGLSMCYSGHCWAEIPENIFVCCGFWHDICLQKN